jgi:hypothetical protein
MHNLTKTLLTSLALTLGACDEPTELGGDFGDEATAFRPTGFNLNTSFIGGQDYGELDLKGLWHKYARVTMVCLSERGVCIYPSKGDALWVEAGEIMAAKNGVKYRGTSFSGSRWYLDLDHDRDGVKDSTIQTLIQKASANKTVQTSVPYWDYTWAYDSKTAAGLVTKYVKQQEAPTPRPRPRRSSRTSRTACSSPATRARPARRRPGATCSTRSGTRPTPTCSG